MIYKEKPCRRQGGSGLRSLQCARIVCRNGMNAVVCRMAPQRPGDSGQASAVAPLPAGNGSHKATCTPGERKQGAT